MVSTTRSIAAQTDVALKNARSNNREYIVRKSAQQSPKPHKRAQLEPPRVLYAQSWMGMGMATAALGLAGMRQFGLSAALGMGGMGALGLAHMMLVEPTRPVLEQLEIRCPTLPEGLDGLRIGHITDIHLGLKYTDQNLIWAVEQMRQEQPELIVITGDLIGAKHAIADLPGLMRGLEAPLGVYAIPGNHDYDEGLADLHGALTLLDIPLLLNENRRLRYRGADLWLLGLDDLWDGRPNLDAALDGVPSDAFKLLLAHEPDMAEEAAQRGVQVQLSGHTHGGHLRLPFLKPFTRPRYGVRYVIGSYKVGDMDLYVSRGLGGAPLRLLCPPEATIITLRRG